MKNAIIILLIISIMISCKSEIKEKEIVNSESKKISTIQRDIFSFNGKYESSSSANLKSELKSKLIKLENLEHNYQIVKIEKSTFEESTVCRGMEILSELSSERFVYEIKNLDQFKNGIEEINIAFIKGTKDLGGKLFSRAKLEELIFKSEESAIKLVEFLNQLNTWEDLDKSPSSIFNDENKVYYISSGGFYMKPFYKEIAKEMKK